MNPAFIRQIRKCAATLTIVVSLGSFTPVFAAYQASDLLGQLDENDDPFYTSGGANNAPNAQGFNGLSHVLPDTVHHRLFVTDSINNRLMVFNLDSSNIIQNRTSDFVLGQPNIKTTSAGTTAAKLRSPGRMAYDGTNDRLYACDLANRRLLKYDTATITNGENALLVLGQTDFVSSASAITRTGMGSCNGVAVDVAGDRLFVADSVGNRVLEYDGASSLANGASASHVLGQTTFTASGAATTATGLSLPRQPLFDPDTGLLYVVDRGNHRVVVYDVTSISDGEAAIYVIGQTAFTTATAAITQRGMNSPEGATLDTVGDRLFVGNSTPGNRVLVYDISLANLASEAVGLGTATDATGVLGQPDFTTSTATVSQTSTSNPQVPGYDSVAGRLYVPEFIQANRVLVYDVNSVVNGEAAVDLLGQLDETDAPVYTTSSTNDTLNQRGVVSSNQIAIDTNNHRLFMADGGNCRLLVFNLDSDNELIDHKADYILGQSDFKSAACTTISSTSVHVPGQLFFDPDRNWLYVQQSQGGFVVQRISIFDVASITNNEAAIHVLGQSGFTTGAAATTATGVNNPRDFAFDDDRQLLYVADLSNSRVLVYDTSDGVSDGEAAIHVLGQSSFTTAIAGTSSTSLRFPQGLALDKQNQRLFVGDGNRRVMQFDVNTITDGEPAVHVLGQTSFTASTSALTQSGLFGTTIPGVEYISDSQYLMVSDFSGNRILFYDIASISDGEAAIGVIGQEDFTSSTNTIDNKHIPNVFGLNYIGDQARLWAGASNATANRNMMFDMPHLETQTLSDARVGDALHVPFSTTNIQGSTSFSLRSGTLPPGVTLGSLDGTPTAAGTYTFTVAALDHIGSSGTIPSNGVTYTIIVQPGGGGTVGGGGIVFGPTPTLSPTPSPIPTPAPGSIIINNDAKSTSSRYVTLKLDSPFGSETTGMRLVNADEFQPADRDTLSSLRQTQRSGLTVATQELRSGSLHPFAPAFKNWDLCRGALSCDPGQYSVYVQYSKPGSVSDIYRVYGAVGDVDSGAYDDSIQYAYPTPTPSPTPLPSPQPMPSATPVPSAIPTPSNQPVPSASPGVTPVPSTSPISLISGIVLGDAVEIASRAISIFSTLPVLLSLVLLGALGELAGLLQFVRQALLEVFGLKRRRPVWGTVYDSKTKHPLAFAQIRLLDESKRLLETRFADRDGRYGFLVSSKDLEGKSFAVSMNASKQGYIFPSQFITGDPDFYVYDHVYTGQSVIVPQNVLVNYNIPMDPAGSVRTFSGMMPLSGWSGLMKQFLDIGFWLGLVILPLNAFYHPGLRTFGVLALFVLVNAVRIFGDLWRPFGVIYDDLTGKPLPFALVTVIDPATRQRTGFTVSDEHGRYIISVPKGPHILNAYTPANVSPPRMTETAIVTRRGWITKKLAV